MACRLVALDKKPGVRPVGIGESIRRLLAKCVVKIAGSEAMQAASNLNLCAGLPAGIEGAVHALLTKWTEEIDPDEELDPDNPLTCLLIDA